MNIPSGWRVLEPYETVYDGYRCRLKANEHDDWELIQWNPGVEAILWPNHWFIMQDPNYTPPQPKPDKEWLNPWE